MVCGSGDDMHVEEFLVRKVQGELECRYLSSFYQPPLVQDFSDHVYPERSWSLDFPKGFTVALDTGSFNPMQSESV
jgi:hypothetical protein